MCTRIWTALAKLIRSQTTKNRIIDTLYFGSFGKATALKKDVDGDGNWGFFCYCPGPRSMFTLVENEQNMRSFSQSVSDISTYISWDVTNLIYYRFLKTSSCLLASKQLLMSVTVHQTLYRQSFRQSEMSW